MTQQLDWFADNKFPLFLAPMAGVTDVVFRRICKRLGADVLVSEFVSAEGILQRDERTRKYTEFDDEQRPLGVQLFGSDGERMGLAACKIISWKQPDFIDINYGCPVNKVVAKNGGSSLLKDCGLVASVASGIVKAVNGQVPVTAKIRLGWDENNRNALQVCKILEDCGIAMITVHGRTRSQGYSGQADWDMIAECVQAVSIPVVGNGDVRTVEDVVQRKNTTGVAGIMIGRAAMENPWIFAQAKAYLQSGVIPEPVSLQQKWELMLEHTAAALQSQRYGAELSTMRAMRARLMAYCKGFNGAKDLRGQLCQLESYAALLELATSHGYVAAAH